MSKSPFSIFSNLRDKRQRRSLAWRIYYWTSDRLYDAALLLVEVRVRLREWRQGLGRRKR